MATRLRSKKRRRSDEGGSPEFVNEEAAKRLRAVAKVLERGKAWVTEFEYEKLNHSVRLEIAWKARKK